MPILAGYVPRLTKLHVQGGQSDMTAYAPFLALFRHLQILAIDEVKLDDCSLLDWPKPTFTLKDFTWNAVFDVPRQLSTAELNWLLDLSRPSLIRATIMTCPGGHLGAGLVGPWVQLKTLDLFQSYDLKDDYGTAAAVKEALQVVELGRVPSLRRLKMEFCSIATTAEDADRLADEVTEASTSLEHELGRKIFHAHWDCCAL